MSLGVHTEKKYLNIKDGRITHKDRSGEVKFYDYLEGYLKGITTRDRDFRGETVKYWYLDFMDEDSGELYSLSLSYHSGVVKSILNSLASAERLGLIRITPYQSGDFTKVVVTNNGETLSWKYAKLPPREEVVVGGRTVKDESKRMRFFETIAREVLNTVTRGNKGT